MSLAATLQSGEPIMSRNYLQGWLHKKSPTGIKGFRVWQKRYFKFLPSGRDPNGIAEFLAYFKDPKDAEPVYRILLEHIQYAEYLPNRHEGARFNINTSERVYELHGDTIKEAKSWVQAINAAVQDSKAKKAEKIEAVVNAAKDESIIKWTRLQELFFSLMYGKDVYQQTVQHQQELDRLKALEEAKRQELKMQLSPFQKVALPNALRGAVKIMIVPPSFLARDLDGNSNDTKNGEVDIDEAMGARGKTFDWKDIEDMKQNFGTDALVIRYILSNVVQPFITADEHDKREQMEKSVFAARNRKESLSISLTPSQKDERSPTLEADLPDWASDRVYLCAISGCELPLVGKSKYCIVHRPRSNDHKQKTWNDSLHACTAASMAASGRVTLSSIFSKIDQANVMRQTSNESQSPSTPRSASMSRGVSGSAIPASPSFESTASDISSVPSLDALASPREPPRSAIASFNLQPFDAYDDKPLSVRDRIQKLNDVNAAHIAYMKRLKEKADALAKQQAQKEEEAAAAAAAKPQLHSRGTDVDMRLLNELKAKSFVRTLLEVFSTSDTEAHALGVTLLYFLVPQQFAAYLQIYMSGDRLSVRVKDALLNILLREDPEIIPNVDSPVTVGLFRPVVHPDAWPALFYAIQHSAMPMRQQVLQDCNALLISSPDNCSTVERGRGWQSWLFPLLTDIHLKVKNEEPYKTTFMLVINTIVLVLFEAFHAKFDAHNLVYNTLDALRYFSGTNDQSQDVGRTVLFGLVNKLAADRTKFPASDFLEEPGWVNFMALTRVLRRFVFQSSYWETNSPVLQIEELPMNEKKARKVEPARSPIERQRMAMFEIERKKLEQEAMNYILHKERTVINEHSVFLRDDDIPLEFHGLHWAEDGKCADLDLVQKVCLLFQALKIHTYDKDMHPSVTPEDNDFLVWAASEYQFWKAAYSFCSLPNRPAIEATLVTYRKLSYLIADLLRARLPAAREELIKELQTRMDAPRLVIAEPAPPQAPASVNIKDAPTHSRALSRKAGGPGLTGLLPRNLSDPLPQVRTKHTQSVGGPHETPGRSTEDEEDKQLLAPPPPLHIRQQSAPEVFAGSSSSTDAPAPTFRSFLNSSTWSALWPGPNDVDLPSMSGAFGSISTGGDDELAEEEEVPPPPPM